MTRIARLTVFFSILTAACGGGGDPTDPNGNPSGTGSTFSAKIDGVAWNSATLYSSAVGTTNGTYVITGGTGVVSAPVMSLLLYNISGPGTFPIGVGTGLTGGGGNVSQSSVGYITPLSGNAGTVTVSSLSSTRIKGTFSFVAAPTLPGTGTNKTVTDGVFDVPLTISGSVAVPANAGGAWAGTLGGAPWNGATAVMVTSPSSGTLTLGASNTTHLINFIISGYTGVGTYTMGTGVSRTVSVFPTGSAQGYGGTNALTSGTVTITSATASRIAGTYNVTVLPTTGSQPALTLSGAFDVGIP